MQLVQRAPAEYRLDGATALKFSAPSESAAERLALVAALLDTLEPGSKN